MFSTIIFKYNFSKLNLLFVYNIVYNVGNSIHLGTSLYFPSVELHYIMMMYKYL